jgi:hypothetical protein
MVYLITYDLRRPGQQYTTLYQAIENVNWFDSSWHYLESVWLVRSTFFQNATTIAQQLLPHIDTNDMLLVVGITQDFVVGASSDARIGSSAPTLTNDNAFNFFLGFDSSNPKQHGQVNTTSYLHLLTNNEPLWLFLFKTRRITMQIGY